MSADRFIATFASGCFWGVEEAFRQSGKILSSRVGYMGGTTLHPTYKDVCTGKTGHAEAVQVEYSRTVAYQDLLEIFWSIHDPTTLNRQGPDIGSQYRSVVFCHSPEQYDAAMKSKASRPGKIVTEIIKAEDMVFYPAEDYHQKYLSKNPGRGCHVYYPN